MNKVLVLVKANIHPGFPRHIVFFSGGGAFDPGTQVDFLKKSPNLSGFCKTNMSWKLHLGVWIDSVNCQCMIRARRMCHSDLFFSSVPSILSPLTTRPWCPCSQRLCCRDWNTVGQVHRYPLHNESSTSSVYSSTKSFIGQSPDYIFDLLVSVCLQQYPIRSLCKQNHSVSAYRE